MREVALNTPVLSGMAKSRADAALAARRVAKPFDRDHARTELNALIEQAGTADA
jgi:beta-N-acetylhexosaminidase